MEKLNIQSTVLPTDPLGENEWMKKFKVSSRFDPTDIKEGVGFSTIYRKSKTSNMHKPLFNSERFQLTLETHPAFSN